MAAVKYPLLCYRLIATSLLEVIVAMIVLLILFFIAINFFVLANRSGFDVQKMSAINALDEYILLTDQNKNYHTNREIINGWTISRESVPYENNDSLIHIKYIVYGKGSDLTPVFHRNVLKNTGSE